MRSFIAICLSLFLLQVSGVSAKPLHLSSKEVETPPNRIIRTCCSFGSDLRVAVLPTVKVTHISSLEKVGPHQYLGNEKEGNGIIYTKRGGFIDLAHLRDNADWTAYLYALIREKQGKGEVMNRLGHEGGTKALQFNLPDNLDSLDAMLLAGRIAYDLSVWHEIATWFGASYVPMLTERYSSFSVEDAYSNLLGVQLGIQALQSDLPYEEAMTQLIAKTLADLQAVPTEAETYSAMEVVRNLWWTRERKLPSGKVLLERQLAVYNKIQPLIVPGLAEANETPVALTVPETANTGQPLSNLYQLLIKPNYKFPLREIFPNQNKRFVTQKDFDVFLAQVAKEWEEYMHPSANMHRRQAVSQAN